MTRTTVLVLLSVGFGMEETIALFISLFLEVEDNSHQKS